MDLQLVKMFSNSLGCHSAKMTVSFAVPGLLSFMGFHLLITCLWAYTTSVLSRKSFLCQWVQDYSDTSFSVRFRKLRLCWDPWFVAGFFAGWQKWISFVLLKDFYIVWLVPTMCWRYCLFSSVHFWLFVQMKCPQEGYCVMSGSSVDPLTMCLSLGQYQDIFIIRAPHSTTWQLGWSHIWQFFY